MIKYAFSTSSLSNSIPYESYIAHRSHRRQFIPLTNPGNVLRHLDVHMYPTQSLRKTSLRPSSDFSPNVVSDPLIVWSLIIELTYIWITFTTGSANSNGTRSTNRINTLRGNDALITQYYICISGFQRELMLHASQWRPPFLFTSIQMILLHSTIDYCPSYKGQSFVTDDDAQPCQDVAAGCCIGYTLVLHFLVASGLLHGLL